MIHLNLTRQDWMDRAECRAHPDPDMWFRAEQPSGTTREKEAVAYVCSTCAVMAECVDYAIAIDAEGVWGGLTSAERRRVRRRCK